MQLGNWSIEVSASGALDLICQSRGIDLRGCKPEIKESGDGTVAVMKLQAADGGVFEYANDRWTVTLTIRQGRNDDWIAIDSETTNTSGEPIGIDDLSPVCAHQINSVPKFDRVYRNGRGMCDFTRLFPLGENHESHCVTGLTNAGGDIACVVGFERFDKVASVIEINTTKSKVEILRPYCEREGIAVAPGATVQSPALLIGAGPSLS